MSAAVTHVDADVLAEFRAGLITGRRGATIAAHLECCDRCTALDGELARVSVLLASVPAPAMPDRVAQRLDTVLAAEMARRDDAERARGERSPEPAASPRRAVHRRFRLPSLRVLAPVAAAAAVVLAASGYGLSLIASGPGSQVTASSAGSAAKAVGRPNGSANHAAAPLESAAPAPSARSELRSPASVTVVPVGTDFQQVTFDQQLKAALQVAPAGRAATARIRGCVQKVTDGASLVLVLSARYEGQPATIIVARTGPDETAWVAGSGCSSTNRDVLYTTSLPSGI
jgi:hypothetical protein